MPGRDVVVVGFSAGGVEAMARLAAGLPRDLPGTVLVSIISPPTAKARSPAYSDGRDHFRRYTPSTTKRLSPAGSTSLRRAICLAENRIDLSRGPRENGPRPASLNLDTGLPVEQLRGPVKACLMQEAEFLPVYLEATNRRGKRIRVEVICSPLVPKRGAERTGVILVMEEADTNL